MTRSTKWVAAAALAASLAIGPAMAQEEWRFAHEESPGDVQDIYAQEFKRLVEERTNGEVTVTIYTYGQLGTEDDLTELTASGAIQFSNASPGHLGTYVPEVQVLLVPYLLSEDPDVNKEVLTHSEALYEDLARDFEGRGLTLYSVYPEGEMVWTTNRPIRSPEDLDGVKFRVMTSPMLIETYDTFGADPIATPWGEVYSGLQLGMLDAQVNPIFFIESAGFYEVQDYLIWTGEQEYTTTVVANNAFWQGLSEEHRQMLLDIREPLADFIFEEQQRMNEASAERIKEARPEIEFIVLDDEERAAFRERAEPLADRLVEIAGGNSAAILEKLRQEIEEAEANQ
jgi:TRAP-type transport system periplasmic protein